MTESTTFEAEDRLPGLEDECFFIAPIGPEGSATRRRSDGIFEFIVTRAAQELGLSPVRADRIAEPGQINLQVVDHVLGAKAAVVDLTDLNPNVFYELAVRHTVRLPVALIAQSGSELPFDIAQMRTIFFDSTDLRSADNCRREIVRHLNEAMSGAVDSPIATSIDLRKMESGDAVERRLAELVTTIDEIAKASQRNSSSIERILYVLEESEEQISPVVLDDLLSHLLELRVRLQTSEDEQLAEVLGRLEQPVNYIRSRRRGHPRTP